MKCKFKIESGSINGKSKYIWIDGRITRMIDRDRYAVRTLDGNDLFYVYRKELWINLKDMMDAVDSNFGILIADPE